MNKFLLVPKSQIEKRIEELQNNLDYAEKEPLKSDIYSCEIWEIQINELKQLVKKRKQ